MTTNVTIRGAEADDLVEMLRLNARWEHFMSRLDRAGLERLCEQAAFVRVAVVDADVTGFLLAFREGAAYASPNYRWFSEAYPRFLYIDRVVVDDDRQRSGLGRALYDDAAVFARRHCLPRIVCEIDLEPPNAASLAFHERYGFTEVGTQRVGDARKLVSLREMRLP